jgi:hypothetical protein
VRAAPRHEQPQGEHPGSPGHLGTCDRGAYAIPRRAANPHGHATSRVPASRPHAVQDQGRAPPVLSGT